MSPRGHAPLDLSPGSLRSGHGVMFRSLLLAVLALTGCAKRAAHETSAPDARGAGGDFEAEIDGIERELAGREAQLRSLGFAARLQSTTARAEEAEMQRDANVAATKSAAGAVPSGDSAPTSAPAAERPTEPAPASRCETVCDLSASICQLQDRICDLAPRHAGEPRYQAACERAAADCQLSTEACHACS